MTNRTGGSSQLPSQPLRVLVDTNVILDWMLTRLPWSVDAEPLWLAHQSQLVDVYIYLRPL